jgi:Tfp pilus assembly protein PilV
MNFTGKTGSTLTEVVVSLFLLTLFMGGAYRLMTQALWANQQARDHYVAINLAASRLERARNMNTDLSLLAENQVVMTAIGTPISTGSYRRTTTITSVASNLTELVIRVDIINRRTRSFTNGFSEVLASLLVK